MDEQGAAQMLGESFELPCGVVLKNRLIKSAMSDSLGDGAGGVTTEQIRLYERWANGGAALSIIGEVQVDHRYPEKPGNLVIDGHADEARLNQLANAGTRNNAHIWPQLGHAGALAHGPISAPAGPSALAVDDLHCRALTMAEIEELPLVYAAAAQRAKRCGFSGVEVHAGHGFLLSQFLSPLFNHRHDRYGGSNEARAQILIDIVNRIRHETDPEFAIGVKLNATDQLEGGLTEDDALEVVELLDRTTVDLIDISGGTYFPGAASSSDRRSSGPYFVDFARRARTVTSKPLMLTGGFKTRQQASAVISDGNADFVGLARTLVLDPDMPTKWLGPDGGDPAFPDLASPPPGGVTAWYTMRLTAIAQNRETGFGPTSCAALEEYEQRDEGRIAAWNSRHAR